MFPLFLLHPKIDYVIDPSPLLSVFEYFSCHFYQGVFMTSNPWCGSSSSSFISIFVQSSVAGHAAQTIGPRVLSIRSLPFGRCFSCLGQCHRLPRTTAQVP